MKHFILLSVFALISASNLLAQLSSENCFDQYYNLFTQRGTKTIPDGVQKIVVATKFEKSGSGNCFIGRVTVKNGEMMMPFMIEKIDGTFTEFKSELSPAFKYSTVDNKRKIENGMSITFRTKEDEYLKCYFIDFLEDKPKANKVAPMASSF